MRTTCWLFALTAACGTTPSATPAAPAAPAAPVSSPVAVATTDAAGRTDDRAATEAERRARAAWFAFELTEVDRQFAGDWVAFERHKRTEEDALARDWKTHAAGYSFRSWAPASAEEVRAVRVLQQEFDQVAKRREPQFREAALAALAALAARRFDDLTRDCIYYGGPDRERLCRKRFEGQAAAFAAAAALFDPTIGFTDISFDSPNPATGMVGQVLLSFGPTTAPPKLVGNRYPARHQIELWWNGQVMPDANGPVLAAPTGPAALDGRWRFYDLVLPYSREPALLQ